MVTILTCEQRELVERNLDCIDLALRKFPAYCRDEYISEAYVKICELALKEYKSEEEFRKIAVTSLKNMAYTMHRNSDREVALNEYIEDQRFEDNSEGYCQIMGFIDGLREEEKFIIYKRYLGYSLKEIAEMLGVDYWIVTYLFSKIKKKYFESEEI